MILFAEYPKCTTCQKAKAWLEAKGVSFTARHVVRNLLAMQETKVQSPGWEDPLDKRMAICSSILA